MQFVITTAYIIYIFHKVWRHEVGGLSFTPKPQDKLIQKKIPLLTNNTVAIKKMTIIIIKVFPLDILHILQFISQHNYNYKLEFLLTLLLTFAANLIFQL